MGEGGGDNQQMVTLIETVNHIVRSEDKDGEFGSGVTNVRPVVRR